MRRAITLISVSVLTALAVAMAWLANFDSLGAYVFVGAMFLFNALPVAAAWAVGLSARHRIFAPVMLFFIILWSGYEAYTVYQNFAEFDGQSGLVFVGLPPLGVGALLVTALFAVGIARLER